ncbi:inactive phospholipase D5 [Alosa pseudoharengus]|uniref:inactive phospholipase D5 n=1 Tax=Alosa pseudoharengus TaxID=34774 RepID=UPI003F8A1A9C
MKSQQKCIVIFALVCCFAVLVALIFSAVDVWGEDEDGITEENCSKTCRMIIVENIPENVSLPHNGTTSLTSGLHSLLDLARRYVEIVSPHWTLNSTDYEASIPTAKQGRLLLHRLMDLKSQKVNLKVVSGLTDSKELKILSRHGADIHYLNMTTLTNGQMLSSFWVVDNKHIYIGSAGMDWRALSTLKELGVILYECSCLALDLRRLFSLYRQLQYKDFIPSIWSKRVYGLYNKKRPLQLVLNDVNAEGYPSNSPDVLCPKDRVRDIDAIFNVIEDANKFIYISVTDYLPLVSNGLNRYWSAIDGKLREAVLLRNIKVRLLVSCWEQTHPLTFNFMWSLKSLCMDMANCSLEAKFFIPRKLDGMIEGINHNRYMVTDNAIYIGNFGWVGNEFVYNAGAGLVISQERKDPEDQNITMVQQMSAVFERDWHSRYSKTLQLNKIPVCNKHTVLPQSLKAWDESVDNPDSPNASLGISTYLYYMSGHYMGQAMAKHGALVCLPRL